jgi:hypothetical protein
MSEKNEQTNAAAPTTPVDPDETTQVENNAPADAGETKDQFPADMWANLANDDDDEGEEDVTSVPEASDEPAEEESAQEEESVEASPPTQEPVAPAPQPENVVQQPPVEQQAQPQQPQISQEELQKQLEAQRAQVLEQLSKQFPISQEDADLLVTSPEQVMPKLAANLFLRTYEAVMQGVRQQMPQMMMVATQMQEQKTTLENEFYSKWEGLDRQKHGELVNRYGMVYLQANPGASREDFIRDVGASAMVALGLPFQQMQQPAPQTPPPVQPSAPVARPAAPNGPKNQFEALAADFEEEDI